MCLLSNSLVSCTMNWAVLQGDGGGGERLSPIGWEGLSRDRQALDSGDSDSKCCPWSSGVYSIELWTTSFSNCMSLSVFHLGGMSSDNNSWGFEWVEYWNILWMPQRKKEHSKWFCGIIPKSYRWRSIQRRLSGVVFTSRVCQLFLSTGLQHYSMFLLIIGNRIHWSLLQSQKTNPK